MFHTFEEPSFLSNLLTVARMHGVKLTALLQAAMLQAVHNSADPQPGLEDIYKNSAAIDLRTNHLISPFNERNKYINNAVSLQNIEIPCKLFESNDFWTLVSHVANQWAIVKSKSGFAKISETDAQNFLGALNNSR
jgi:hypothetical protein